MSWGGLYEDLPPPSITGPSTVASTSSSSLPSSSSSTSATLASGSTSATVASSSKPTTTTTDAKKADVVSEWSAGAKLLAPALRRKAAAAAKPAAPKIDPSKIKKAYTLASTPVTIIHQQQSDIQDNAPNDNQHAQSLVSQAQLGEYQDVYDPSKPNDYEELLEERKHKPARYSAKEEAIKANPSFKPPAIYQEEVEDEPERPSMMRFNDSDHRRHESDDYADNRKRKSDYNSSSSSSGNFRESSSKSSGNNSAVANMMAKMGYKQGQGLGKEEQGITAPLMTKKTDQKSGVILAGDAASSKKMRIASSRVIALLNMVGPGEVDKELQREIEEECTKYGRVDRSLIYEDKAPGVPNNEVVRIFVKFFSHTDAVKALDDLNGRFFGGRKVVAKLYDEELFDDRRLSYIDA